MANWRDKLPDAIGRACCSVCGQWKCLCEEERDKRNKRDQVKVKEILNKGSKWREARARNLRNQIQELRKKIAFWKSLGADENEAQARRDMISLKSKLADITRAR